jgi:hypothetical protein
MAAQRVAAQLCLLRAGEVAKRRLSANAESEQETPITSAEEADRIVRSFQEKPVGLLSEEEKRQRLKDFKRALAFNHKRFEDEDASRPTAPPAVTEKNDAALRWCAARCIDSSFQKRLEGLVINAIKEGVLFESPLNMLQTSLERLLVVAANPVEPKFPSLPSLNQFFDPVKKAQEEQAVITSLFVLASNPRSR